MEAVRELVGVGAPGHLQLERLPPVAQVRGATHGRDLETLVGDRAPRSALEVVPVAGQGRGGDRPQLTEVGPSAVHGHRGGQQPQRRQDPGVGWHEHRRAAELCRQRRLVQGPGPAEGQQGEPARIMAAFDGDEPQGLRHRGIGHGDDPGGARPDLQTEFRRQGGDGGFGQVGTQGQRTAEPHVGIEAAEHHVGVGDRGRRPAEPVARRARVRSGGAGSDAQRPTVIAPRQRPAARPDRVEVGGGHGEGQPPDLAVGGGPGPPVGDQGDVGGGPADIEGDQRRHPARSAERGRAPRTGGGSGQHGTHGLAGGDGGGGRPAPRPHHLDRHPEPVGGQALRQGTEVAVHPRREVGVEHHGRGALHLAQHGQQAAGGGDGHPERCQRCGQPLLVAAVEEAEQQADRHGLGSERGDGLDDPRHLGVGQGSVHRAVRVGALDDLDHTFARDQRGGAAGVEPVEVRAVLTGDGQQIPEPRGRDEHGAGPVTLQHGVGRHGGAVDEAVELADGHLGAFERGADAVRLIGGGGGHLGDRQPVANEVDEVGEGAADVDAGAVTVADRHGHTRPKPTTPRRVSPSARTRTLLPLLGASTTCPPPM